MRQYGRCEATEFSKKQIGVIYRNAKLGNLKVERWLMSRLYDLADFYDIDWGKQIAKEEQTVLKILDLVFGDKLEEAQKELDSYGEKIFKAMSIKNQKEANRELVS